MKRTLEARIKALESAQAGPDDDLPTEIWLCAPGDEDHGVLLWSRRTEPCED